MHQLGALLKPTRLDKQLTETSVPRDFSDTTLCQSPFFQADSFDVHQPVGAGSAQIYQSIVPNSGWVARVPRAREEKGLVDQASDQKTIATKRLARRIVLGWIIFLASISLVIVVAASAAAQEHEWSLVVRLNPALDDIIPLDAAVERLTGNFGFLEGPVWVRTGGYLLFSDVAANVINKWNPSDGKVSIFLAYSGFTGTDPTTAGAQHDDGNRVLTLLGPNGLTLDSQGRPVYGAQGDRQVVRVEDEWHTHRAGESV